MRRSYEHHRVLVLAPGRATRGGITAVVKAHASHPVWQKWRCTWIETHADRNAAYKLFYFFRAMFRFTYLLPSHEIIHIHFSEPVSAIRKMFFLLPAKLFRKKIILHFHSFSPETTLRSSFGWLYGWMFRQADAIIVLSERWRKELVAAFGPQLPVRTIYNPASIHAAGMADREDYILFAGTLNQRKGYADLIRAFSMISQRHPHWNLVLAGNGELREAEALSTELGIRDRVVLPGWVNGKRKEELFNRAGLFCLPSYAEGFPMAVIDAMAHRIPVISTPVGGLTDVFQESKEVYLVTPGRCDELAMKLDLMIGHPGIRQQIAGAAYEKITKYFNLDLVAAQLDALYDDLGKKLHAGYTSNEE